MSTDPTPAQTFAPGARVLLPGDRRGVVIGPADGCSAGILAVEVEVPASTTTILTASDYLTAVDGAGTATPPETAALAEVAAERCRQDKKWGEQNHPDGTGGRVGEALAHYLRAFCDQEHGAGFGTWASILAEEVGEAFAEDDAVALRGELVQVAAVAVNWIGAIDRRGAPNEPTVGEALQRLHDKHRGFTDAQLAAATPGEPSPPAEHVGAEEPGVLWMAMRYALGRATYAVGEVGDAIDAHADQLTDAHRHRMAAEIATAIAGDRAGMDMDVVVWRRAVVRLVGDESARALLSGGEQS